MQHQLDRAIQEIAASRRAPDWASQDNLLAKVEAIRLQARASIWALGLDPDEFAVDVSIIPADSNELFHLAKELGWQSRQHWYEPPAPTEGGDITIYYEPEEQVFY